MPIMFHDILLGLLDDTHVGKPAAADLLRRVSSQNSQIAGRLGKAVEGIGDDLLRQLAAILASSSAPRLLSGRHLIALARIVRSSTSGQAAASENPGADRDLALKLVRTGCLVPVGYSAQDTVRPGRVDDFEHLADAIELDGFYANGLASSSIDAAEIASILGSPEGVTRKAVVTMRSVLQPSSRIDLPGARPRLHLVAGDGPWKQTSSGADRQLPEDPDLGQNLVVAELSAMAPPSAIAAKCMRRTPYGLVVYRHLPGFDLMSDIGRFVAVRMANHPIPSPLLSWPNAARQALSSLGGMELVRPDGRLEIHLTATKEGALIDWLVSWRHELSRAPSHWIDIGDLDTELFAWLAVKNNLGLWARTWLETRRAVADGKVPVRDFDHVIEGRMIQARRPALAIVGSDKDDGTIDRLILDHVRRFSADPGEMKRMQDARSTRHLEMIGIGDNETDAFDRDLDLAMRGESHGRAS